MDITAFNSVCAKLVKAYQDEMSAKGKNASGELAKSASSFVTIDGQRYILWFSAPSYWRWVENGRKAGKYVPIQPLIDWIRVKPIKPLPRTNGTIPTPKQLAFAISTSIKNKGILPTPVLSVAIEKSGVANDMVSIIKRNIDLEVTKVLNFNDLG